MYIANNNVRFIDLASKGVYNQVSKHLQAESVIHRNKFRRVIVQLCQYEELHKYHINLNARPCCVNLPSFKGVSYLRATFSEAHFIAAAKITSPSCGVSIGLRFVDNSGRGDGDLSSVVTNNRERSASISG